MIDNEYGNFKLVCDCCGKESIEFETFDEAVENKEKAGFKSVKVNGKWEHHCSECK